MKPVDQTIIDPLHGNCFQACIASLFEMRLDFVPHFCDGAIGGEWWDPFVEWCARVAGYAPIQFKCDSSWGGWESLSGGVLCILSGASHTFPDTKHVVVGKLVAELHEVKDGIKQRVMMWRTIHDPNPSRKGLKGQPEEVLFFIKINPKVRMLYLQGEPSCKK